jgi:hypothetical protein
MGIPIVRGRDFTDEDNADTKDVVVISEKTAQHFWPGQDPLGKRVKHGRLDNPRPWYTVVGVVADTKAIADPHDGEVVGTVALPLSRWLAIGGDEMTFVVESAGESRSLESDLRHALARADNRLAAYDLISLDEAAARSWVTERFLFVLVSLFGVLGLILVSLVVYAVSFVLLQALSRYREYAADRGSAVITGRPSALASALLKIAGVSERIPSQDLRATQQMKAFYIYWPSGREIIASHPPIEKRVAALQRLESQLQGVAAAA